MPISDIFSKKCMLTLTSWKIGTLALRISQVSLAFIIAEQHRNYLDPFPRIYDQNRSTRDAINEWLMI